jgi:hypothetical protein
VRGLWEPTSWPLTKTKTIQILRYSVSQKCCDSYLYSSWLLGSISLNIFGVNLLTLFCKLGHFIHAKLQTILL